MRSVLPSVCFVTGVTQVAGPASRYKTTMIISDEQVQRVVEYLHTSDAYNAPTHDEIEHSAPLGLMDRVITKLDSLPDVRLDRVEQAREMLTEDFPDADTVAGKLIGRVLSDSLR